MNRYKMPLLLLVFGILPVAVVFTLVLGSMTGDEPEEATAPQAVAPAPGEPAAAPAVPAPPQIVIATRALAAGRLIRASDVTTAPLRPGDEIENAIEVPAGSGAEWLSGHLLTHPVAPGAPLRSEHLRKPDEPGFLAGVLKEGTRATTVNVESATRAAAIIIPGDHVDAIATVRRIEHGREVIRTTTVADELRVIAVDRSKLGENNDSRTQMVTATLETTPTQSKRIVLAANLGQLSLAIRGENAMRDRDEPSATIEDLIGGEPGPPPDVLASAVIEAMDGLEARVTSNVDERNAERINTLGETIAGTIGQKLDEKIGAALDAYSPSAAAGEPSETRAPPTATVRVWDGATPRDIVINIAPLPEDDESGTPTDPVQ